MTLVEGNESTPVIVKSALASADRALTSIGRFVLLRPGVSAFVLITATYLACWNNGLFDASSTEVLLAQSTPPAVKVSIPISTPAAPSPQAVALAHAAEETRLLEEFSQLPQWYITQVTPGDTLATIFQRHKITIAQALAISKLAASKPLRNLKIGQEIRLFVNADNSLKELHYAVNKDSTLTVKHTGTGFAAARLDQPIAMLALNTDASQDQLLPLSTVPTQPILAQATPTETAPTRTSDDGSKLADISNESSVAYASGSITRSLYIDARRAGLSVKQATQVGKMFSANGLVKKLRAGDTFSVLYAKADKGKHQKKGDILLAQLSHKGETHQAIRFTDPKGKTAYYDPKGKSPHPSIVRAPIKNARINSKFTHNRMHPVLHIKRPHLGVDYGARSGAPIGAAGDGVVTYKGYKGGYGNTIMVKHDKKHTTLYAHMSRFAKNIKPGSHVKEGQTIGYVGKTGLASGPHLHYEIHVNGVPKNPLTVALPGGSVPSAHKHAFLAQAKALQAELQLNQGVQFAKNEEGEQASAL